MRLWRRHRHEWTLYGPVQHTAGGTAFQARTCETCGLVQASDTHPWMIFMVPFDAPPIPLERDHAVAPETDG